MTNAIAASRACIEADSAQRSHIKSGLGQKELVLMPGLPG